MCSAKVVRAIYDHACRTRRDTMGFMREARVCVARRVTVGFM